MKSYTKDSRYSEIFKTTLQSGKGLNVAMNNCHIIKELIKDDAETLSIWSKFEKLLKDSKLKLSLFAVGFDSKISQYHIVYQVESKVHRNQPLRATLDDMPTTLIAEVASGL
jgi:hypothetical protein